jgi:hypothetical protein
MAILDDHSKRSIKNLVRQGDDPDQKFCEHVHRDFIQPPQDKRPATGPLFALKLKASRSGTNLGLNDGFVVRHYAGEVSYSTKSWIDKNNDALVPEVESLLRASRKQLVRNLAATEAEGETGERFNSVGHKYLCNLNDLLSTLEQSKLHYIRCFNPNEKRSPGVFEKKYVLDQVIQCGTVELVSIMHDGFPHRCKLEDIRNRFTKLLPEDFRRYKDRDFVEAIMIAFEMPCDQWTVGTSRLFLKAGQLRTLEHLLDTGSVASQEMITRIVRQFARKKLRAARTAIRFALWLPKYARERRRQTVRTQLRSSCRVYVRLHRWLRKARRVLYGASPPRDITAVEWRMQRARAIVPLSGKMILQVKSPPRPQLFLALNHYEIQDYASVLQNKARDGGLAQWQKDATESILFLDDGYLMAVELSPSRLVPRNGSTPSMEDCLSQARFVDVFGTGFVMQTRGEVRQGKISRMCQHPMNTEVFATCHDDAVIIWSWNGTDIRGSATKRALVVESCFIRESREIMYGMSFLSKPPESIAGQGGHVLVTLTGMPNQPWLTIRVMSLFQPDNYRILFQLDIGQDGSLLEAAQSGQLLFSLSNSERLLVVTGKGIVLVFEIRKSPKLSIELVKDLTEDISGNEYEQGTSIASILCMPIPSGADRVRGALDWIVMGDNDGGLYGFLWLLNETTNRAELASDKFVGRFTSKQARHNERVAVGVLVATYGSSMTAHHADVKENDIAYWDYLQQVKCEKDRFLSLGDDGKLLQWGLHRKCAAGCESLQAFAAPVHR